MALQSRLNRMEKAIQPVELVLIDAKDEADYDEQYWQKVWCGGRKPPFTLDLEVHMNGEVRRERINIPIFEELLELLD